MKNLTITLDEETARLARIRASEREMSLSRYIGEVRRKELRHDDAYEAAYRAWHHPAALSLEFPRALTAFAALPPDRTYVVYCEIGWKSATVAERMREAGFAAFHLKGGLDAAMAQAGLVTEEERAVLAPAVRGSG